MMRHSWPKLSTALLCGFAAYLISTGAFAASRRAQAADLARLIPQDKWEASGLDKLTAPEQQTLAVEISGLLGGARAAQASSGSASPARDRSQWRKLHRRMSRDEVKRLLGDPDRISVSRFYESWEYLGGSVTFDGKGRVDFWSEPSF